MKEEVINVETGPSITRKAFADVLFDHPFFGEYEWALDFQYPKAKVDKKGLEDFDISFVITLWHDGNFQYVECEKALQDVHKQITAKYGEAVEGAQPPAPSLLKKYF